MRVSQAKLLLKISGFFIIIAAILAVVLGKPYGAASEMNFLSPYAGYVPEQNFFAALDSMYQRHVSAVVIVAALLFIAGATMAAIGCVLQNESGRAKELRSLKGKITWAGDLEKMRRD